jgi:hypothetical protein
MYLKRVISYEPIEIDENDLITANDAAKELGVTVQTVTIRAQKGLMTIIRDTTVRNPQNAQHLLLRSEVETWKRQRRAKM